MSYAQVNLRLLGDWDGHMPDISPTGSHVLCLVVEDVDNLFGGPYTGTQFTVPPFMTVSVTAGSCIAELHDEFNILTKAFDRPKDGYFQTYVGAISSRNFDPYSFGTATGFGGATLRYHVALFERGAAGTDSDAYTYVVNINQASQTGAGSNNVCGNSDNYCMSWSWMVPCNDMITVETWTWNDPAGSCTTGPTTSCYWASTVYDRATMGATSWGASILGVGSSDPQLSAGPGFVEWFTDASNTSTSASGFSDGAGGYHNVAPSPPGISYGYYSGRRRQLYVSELGAIRERQRAEERKAIFNIFTALNGTLDQPPSKDRHQNYTRHYQWMVLKRWQEYRDTVLKPKWEREIADVEATVEVRHRRRAQVVWNFDPPPPPPSPPPPNAPQFNVFGGMPIMHYRPLYEIVERSYEAPVQTLKDIFDEHIANHSYNATVKQLDDNTYRIILDMKNDNVANLTAQGISQAFMNHLRSHTGLELTLDDEVFRGWRTMCNDSVASPPPPVARWNMLENCAADADLITSADECEEAAAFLGHGFGHSWGGTGCQMFGNTLVWGAASTPEQYNACGVTACVAVNGAGVGCEEIRCACRISPPNPSYSYGYDSVFAERRQPNWHGHAPRVGRRRLADAPHAHASHVHAPPGHTPS